MIFNELAYVIILAFTLLFYWTVPPRLKGLVLAISGILFYCYYAGSSVALLLTVTVVTWALLFGPQYRTETGVLPPPETPAKLGGPISKPIRQASLFCILASVAILGYFKYGSFIGQMITRGDVAKSIPPLAISFFIFEFIHIASERYKGNLVKVPFIEYVAFIFFFPTMVAGPIKRYEQFDTQLQEAELSANNFAEGFFRIAIGLFKKILIADNINNIITEVGSPAKTQNVFLLTAAIILYGFRIYLDFSGYSDIAIGSARLFGIRVPENFLRPYLQTNISAFWRNWHVSLYSWLIDYVYIPLGGSRVPFYRNLTNIMVVMLVSGLWHGAAWNFVLWGFWHGSLLVIHKVYTDKVLPHLNQKLMASFFAKAVSYVITMGAVWFGWLLFMWPLGEVAQYLKLIIGKIA